MATPVFGMPFGSCVIASDSDGVMPIEPMEYQVSYTNHGYATATVSGIIMESAWSNHYSNALAAVSMVDLLAEVNRRIKSGENINTKEKA